MLGSLLTLLAGGCASPESGSYQAIEVYPEPICDAASSVALDYEGLGRNPVIFIHGLLGAELRNFVDGATSRRECPVVWGDFSPSAMSTPEHYRNLALPMRYHRKLVDLEGAVGASGLLERSAVELLGMRFYIDNYDIIIDLLARSGYIPERGALPENRHFYSQFIFYYDWRRDIAENAAKLHQFILNRRKYLQNCYALRYGEKNYDVRFDLIGHSMGGLIARYYLMYGNAPLPEKEQTSLPVTWMGADYVERVIQVGTPNAGYPDTMLELVNGLKLSSLAPTYPASVVGTFVSYYEMLPDPALQQIVYTDDGSAVDYLNIEVWRRYHWGLLDRGKNARILEILLPRTGQSAYRRAIAQDHLEKCLAKARAFKRAMQVSEVPPEPVRFYLFAGDAAPTNTQLGVDRKTGAIRVLKRDAGDGKVPLCNARFDWPTEHNGVTKSFGLHSPILYQAVYYMPGSHMGIMASENFADNLRSILLQRHCETTERPSL